MRGVTLLIHHILLIVQAVQVTERQPVRGRLTHQLLVLALRLQEQEVNQIIVELKLRAPVQTRKEAKARFPGFIQIQHLTLE